MIHSYQNGPVNSTSEYTLGQLRLRVQSDSQYVYMHTIILWLFQNMTVFIIWFRSCKQHIPVGFSEPGLFQLSILWTCKQCIEVEVFLVPLDFSLYDIGDMWFSPSPHTIFCKACRTFYFFFHSPSLTYFRTPLFHQSLRSTHIQNRVIWWRPAYQHVGHLLHDKKNGMMNIIMQKLEKSCNKGRLWEQYDYRETHPYRLLIGKNSWI